VAAGPCVVCKVLCQQAPPTTQRFTSSNWSPLNTCIILALSSLTAHAHGHAQTAVGRRLHEHLVVGAWQKVLTVFNCVLCFCVKFSSFKYRPPQGTRTALRTPYHPVCSCSIHHTATSYSNRTRTAAREKYQTYCVTSTIKHVTHTHTNKHKCKSCRYNCSANICVVQSQSRPVQSSPAS